MRKLGATGDSLELLLDTVCSMFGAIVLIAILVALQAQTSSVPSAGDQAGSELLRRRIAAAEADLAGVQSMAAAVNAGPMDPALAALALEKGQLTQAISEAKERAAKSNASLETQIAQQTVDFSAEAKNLTAREASLRRQLEEAANALKTQDENRQRLEGRTKELQQRLQAEKDAKTVTLRFPKERAQTKRSINVICKFGRVYPLQLARGIKNVQTIEWKDLGDSAITRPIEAQGWTLPADAQPIARLLDHESSREAYFAFFVYPDSFDIFHALRERVTAAGFDFGVSLEEAGAELKWGSKGSTPPPL